MSTCRECHQDQRHKLSCSVSKYGERRTWVLPRDEVIPEHIPTPRYCPGPEVHCYYGEPAAGTCYRTGNTCYYHHED